MTTNETEGMLLSDVLAYVAEQLLMAEKQAKNREQAIMRFEECEVELSVKLEAGAKGGIKVWVIELGANVKREEANKIKVKFRALEGTSIQLPQIPKSPAPKNVRQKRVETKNRNS